MTMTGVDIGHARPARSSDTKVAINYLIASGATAITIAEIDGVCSFLCLPQIKSVRIDGANLQELGVQ